MVISMRVSADLNRAPNEMIAFEKVSISSMVMKYMEKRYGTRIIWNAG